MKTERKWIVGIVIIAVIAALAVLPLSAQAPESNEDIVMEMTKILSEGDFEGAASYFAEDALFLGYWLGEVELTQGREAIAEMFGALAADGFVIESTVVDTFAEGRVLLTEIETSATSMPPGLAPLHSYDVYLIEDGQIVFYFYTVSTESTARLMEIIAAMEAEGSSE